MGKASPERNPLHRRFQSANDRWKARWNDRLAWSTIAAVVLHVVLLTFSPGWIRPDPPPDPAYDALQLEWLGLYEEFGGSDGPASTAAAPVGEEPDSIPLEPGPEGGMRAPEMDRSRLAAALREELRRRSIPEPTVVEAEPDPESDGEDLASSDGDTTVIGGDASAAERESEPGLSALDLDRLSAVRPEVVLEGHSSWVLVRNPNDVERFMRRTTARGDVEPGAEGSVKVTLWIDETGSVEWAEVSESSGQTELDELALELFSEVVVFRPARQQGVRVPISVIFFVHFPW